MTVLPWSVDSLLRQRDADLNAQCLGDALEHRHGRRDALSGLQLGDVVPAPQACRLCEGLLTEPTLLPQVLDLLTEALRGRPCHVCRRRVHKSGSAWKR